MFFSKLDKSYSFFNYSEAVSGKNRIKYLRRDIDNIYLLSDLNKWFLL